MQHATTLKNIGVKRIQHVASNVALVWPALYLHVSHAMVLPCNGCGASKKIFRRHFTTKWCINFSFRCSQSSGIPLESQNLCRWKKRLFGKGL